MLTADALITASADPTKVKKEMDGGAKATAEELSAGQARLAKKDLQRAKAAETERKAKGSYLQVGSRRCWGISPPLNGSMSGRRPSASCGRIHAYGRV
jgi:hypothetical protein